MPYNPNPIGPVLHFPSVTYNNFSVGYNIEPINAIRSGRRRQRVRPAAARDISEQRAQRQYRCEHLRHGRPVLSRQLQREVLGRWLLSRGRLIHPFAGAGDGEALNMPETPIRRD